MSDNPFDQFDAAAPSAAQAPSTASTAQAPAANPFDQFSDEASTPAPASPTPAMSQQEVNDHIIKLLNDASVSGQQLRDFYTSMGGKLNEHDSGIVDQRDIYIAKNHKAPTVGLDTVHATESQSPGLTDNRPYSFGEGVRQGDQHILSNVAGGAGWLANAAGIENNWGDDTRKYFGDLEATEPTQGSAAGHITGEVIASSPAALVAAPIAAGATSIGLPAAAAAGLGMFADGAIQGALTTNSRTPGGVAKDAAIGGTLGTVFGSAAHGLQTLASTPSRAAVQGREMLDAADRLSRDGLRVAPTPADVGGTVMRGAVAAGEAGLTSNAMIRRTTGQYLDATQAVRDRAAGSFAGGQARDINEVAGDVLHNVGGLGDYEARSAERIGQMYDNAAQLAGNTSVPTPTALAALNRIIDQAERAPGNSPGLEALRSLRDDLTPQPDQVVPSSILDQHGNPISSTVVPGDPARYAIDALRRLRTSFGDNFDSNQRAAREAANTIWGPLSEDIQTGLRDAGRGEAADAYRAADQAWAERSSNLDDIVGPALGNRSQEQLANHLIALSRNNSDLLDRALTVMSPDQAAQVRGAIVGNLGRAKSGAQNATGDGFSLPGFLTDWDKLSDGTKNTMLQGQAGQDLQDLARLAEGARDAGRFRNHSNTGRTVEAFHQLSRLASGGAALWTFGKTAAAEAALGAALASPAVGRAAVRMSEVRPIARSAAALAKVGQYVAPVTANGVGPSLGDIK